MLAAIYYVAKAAFVTDIRGNGARLGPLPIPELFERVQHRAGWMGLKRAPAAFLIPRRYVPDGTCHSFWRRGNRGIVRKRRNGRGRCA